MADAGASLRESTLLLQEADDLRRARKCRKALSIYRAILHNHADDAGAHSGAASCSLALNHTRDAYFHAEEALRLDPSLSQPHAVLAILDSRQGKMKSAVGHATAVVAIFPDDSPAQVFLASFLLMSGQVEEGTAALDRALQIDGSNWEALLALSGAERKRRRHRSAIKFVLRALEIGRTPKALLLSIWQVMANYFFLFMVFVGILAGYGCLAGSLPFLGISIGLFAFFVFLRPSRLPWLTYGFFVLFSTLSLMLYLLTVLTRP